MTLNNPVLIELIETAVNERAIVEMNDMSERVTFLYSPVVFYIGYGFDEPVLFIWLDAISSETRITPEEFKTLVSRCSYYRGGMTLLALISLPLFGLLWGAFCYACMQRLLLIDA